MSVIQRAAFWTLVYLGKPVGGIRPRRILWSLGEKAFRDRPIDADFNWYRDRWGSELRLNPRYFLDRMIIAVGSFEEGVHRCIADRVKPGMTCFDIGANIGEMTLHFARRVGPTGRVYSFEPAPAVRARLQAHVDRNPHAKVVHLSPAALSNRTGTAEFAFASEGISNQGMGSLVNRSADLLSNRCSVPTLTIDQFVAEQGISRIDVMKIDIQGAEPLLLEGGKHVFGDLSPDLIMEVSRTDLADLGKTPRDLLAQLADYGYASHILQHDGTPGAAISPDHDFDKEVVDDIFCTKSRK
jgi:FkbM family methyltransferase